MSKKLRIFFYSLVVIFLLSSAALVPGLFGTTVTVYAAPQVESVNGGYESSATTNHTLNLPSGIEAGNLLIAFINVADGSPDPEMTANWTQIFISTGKYSTHELSGWYKNATGDEGSTDYFTTSADVTSQHTTYRISGWNGTAPEEAHIGSQSSAYPNPPSLTPTWGAKNTLWFVVSGNAYSSTVSAYPNNYSNGRNDCTGDGGVGSARRLLNATSEDPGTFTLSASTYWCAATVAIEPGIIAPTVVMSAASSVEEATARLNGNVTDTGEENPNVTVYWGDNDGGETPGNWDYNSPPDSPSQPQGVAAFYKDVTGLSPGNVYFFIAAGTNSAGTGWGTTQTFSTKPEAPSGLTPTDNLATSISLSWSIGSGAEKTMIRYKTSGYPTSPSDGSQGYFNTGSSCNVSGLSSGQVYYFRAWSYHSTGGYSDDYSETTEYTLPGNPSGLIPDVISGVRIDLSWTPGSGADKSMVRYSTNDYPSGPADGTQGYFGTGSECQITSLSPGELYFFRVWGYDSDSTYYSDGYSQASAKTMDNPTISTQAATEISVTSARLNSYVSDDGEDDCYVRFQYGTTYESYTVSDDSYGDVYGANWAGQTFTTGSAYTIDAVALKLYRVGSPGTVNISIRATSGDLPTGGDLTNGTYDGDTLTTSTDGLWYVIDLTDYSLSNGVRYAIIVRAVNGTSDNKVCWRLDSSSPYYSGGSLVTSSNSGVDWSEDTAKDCMFASMGVYTNTTWEGPYTTGQTPHEDIVDLALGTLYRFRAQIYNSVNGIDNPASGSILTFSTDTGMGNVTNLLVSGVTEDEINLVWTKADGSQTTRIVYKIGSYPTDKDDGSIAYSGVGGSCAVTSLTPGTSYYFGAWGFASPNYWSSISDETMGTTLAGVAEGEGVYPLPEQPGNWFTSADTSKLTGMPGYGIIYDAADKMNMPVGSMFLIAGLALASGVGLATYIFTRNLIMLLVASGFVLLGCMIAGIVPGWVFFLYAILAGLAGYILSRGSS